MGLWIARFHGDAPDEVNDNFIDFGIWAHHWEAPGVDKPVWPYHAEPSFPSKEYIWADEGDEVMLVEDDEEGAQEWAQQPGVAWVRPAPPGFFYDSREMDIVVNGNGLWSPAKEFYYCRECSQEWQYHGDDGSCPVDEDAEGWADDDGWQYQELAENAELQGAADLVAAGAVRQTGKCRYEVRSGPALESTFQVNLATLFCSCEAGLLVDCKHLKAARLFAQGRKDDSAPEFRHGTLQPLRLGVPEQVADDNAPVPGDSAPEFRHGTLHPLRPAVPERAGANTEVAPDPEAEHTRALASLIAEERPDVFAFPGFNATRGWHVAVVPRSQVMSRQWDVVTTAEQWEDLKVLPRYQTGVLREPAREGE